LYHVRVRPLAERVLCHLRRQDLLRAGERVGVAVSGGIDSVALLRLLLELRPELGIVLSIVHFNHRLRGAASDGDQEFVAHLAHQHDLEFHTDSDDVAAQAAEEHISVEVAARELRYGFFRYLLGEESAEENQCPPSKLNKIATGHTLDDQAETVLLRLIRGTGLKGLGGIYPRILVADESEQASREIIRPLLAIRRRELESYLRDLHQPWREDSTNADDKFTRNRLRQLVLPVLEREFNPTVTQNLAELAEIARGEQDYWENEIAGWMGTAVNWAEPDLAPGFFSGTLNPQATLPLVQIQPNSEPQRPLSESSQPSVDTSVNRIWLLSEPVAVQRRVIKAIGDHAGIPLEFKHVEAILSFAAEDGPPGKEMSLPLGWRVKRDSAAVVFVASGSRWQEGIANNYEYELPLPGRALVPETGTVIEALKIAPESQTPGYNPQHLLDPDLLRGPLHVRNWRPGDRFWAAHTKSPKKIKELLQARRITQVERQLWPVITNGDEIIWMRGFAVPAKLQSKSGHEAVLIRESPSGEKTW
jgi:tRNA(Ile)-lysidine synthase